MVNVEVSGMSCAHCVATVTKTVRELPSVTDVRVDLAAGTVAVEGGADPKAVVAAIAAAGYDVSGMRETPGAR